MKILLIDVNFKYSSTGKIVYDLYHHINASGNEAAVCYGRGLNIKMPNVYKFGINAETYFHALMTRLTGWTGIYSPFSTKRLIKFINKFKPDIVHIHELHAYFVNLAPVIKYLKNNNIKTIWTFHCEFMYTGKCGITHGCEKYRTQCYKCPQLREYPTSLFFDWTKQMFNQKKKLMSNFSGLSIITPSKWLASKVSKSFLNSFPLQVIHNGIDTEYVFTPKNHNSQILETDIRNKKIVLAVAPHLLSEQKGGKHVIELSKRFIGNDEVHFIMIGISKNDINKYSNVTMLEPIANQKLLAQYYNIADAFVICSKNENFPTTCLEALACKTPVFGFDVGGVKETAPKPLGNFVEHGNINALESTIKEYLTSENIDEIKNKCRQYAENNYSKKAMFDNYLNKCYLS
jgi:putative colanic acid biosynthesis glycosyltransferase